MLGQDLNGPGRSQQEGLCYNIAEASPPSEPLTKNRFDYSYTQGSEAKARFDAAVRGLTDAVTNLGDAALWDPTSSTMHVLKGDGYLEIVLPDTPEPRAKAIALAQIALRRIG